MFEITPQGLKRDADVEREKSIGQTTAKKLDRIIPVVLASALAYFAFDKFVLDAARDQSTIEIARQEGRFEAIVDSYEYSHHLPIFFLLPVVHADFSLYWRNQC